MKESLSQIINALEKITGCSATAPNFINSVTNNHMSILDELKDEAKKLLEEVNCYNEKFSSQAIKCGSSFAAENTFEGHFKERIEQLKQKIRLLEVSFLPQS